MTISFANASIAEVSFLELSILVDFTLTLSALEQKNSKCCLSK